MQKALTENDTVTVNKIKKEYKNFQNDMNDYSKTFIKKVIQSKNPELYNLINNNKKLKEYKNKNSKYESI